MKSKRRFIETVVISAFLCLATSLSAATPLLHTDANLIKDPCNNVVVLRGVDTIDIGAIHSWYSGGVQALIDRVTDKSNTEGNSLGWYTRVIRLAVYPSDEEDFSSPFTFTPGSDTYYNTLLRPVVDYCREKDLYVIIDWHYVGNNTYDKVSQTSAFWSYMAPKFAGDSHVLFELFNEPLNDLNGDWIFNANDAADWNSVRTNMQTWIDIIRPSAPNNLILVSGPYYSQLIGPAASNPLTGNNIVMVSHIYPGHWLDSSWSSSYKNQVDTCLTHYPVFMSEWGFRGSLSGNLKGTIANYGQPLSDWREARKISNSAWVTDYAWQPQMFDSSWNLLVGPGEMGGFTKDLLYTYRNNDQPGGGDTNAPAAPTGLTATAGNSTVALDWNDNNESDLAGYNVYRTLTSGSGYSKLNSSLVSSSNYTDNAAGGGRTYYYVVTAVDNSFNESDDSSEVFATPSDTIPPLPPTGLTASGGNGTATLNWNDNAESDLAGYNVYRSTTSGSGYIKQNGSLLTSSNYIDNAVTNGTTYYYVVTAVDIVTNESNYSIEDSATPGVNIEILGSWATGTSHTKESGTNRALVFIAHVEHSSAITLNSVTYGGQPMTKVLDTIIGSGTRAYVVVYILDEAGVAAATGNPPAFNPTWSATPGAVGYASVFLGNVDQSDLIGASAYNGVESSTPNPITTTPLVTSSGDMVFVAATCGNSGSYTLNNGFTEGTDQTMGSTATGAAGRKLATGASETPSATYNTGPNRQVIIGFVVNAQNAPTYSNCGEVIAAGHRLPADISGAGNCYVDYEDLDTFVEYWLNTNCTGPDNCHGADFVPTDGVVDLFDFSDFAMQWLVCNDPEDPECPHNW